VEGVWSDPTSIRQGSRKVGFYFYRSLTYDLEGLTPGTRQCRKVEGVCSDPTSIRQGSRKVGFYFYRSLPYDLEGLTPGTRQCRKEKRARIERKIQIGGL